MQKISYALAIRCLMYTQVCTHPDIAFIEGFKQPRNGSLGSSQIGYRLSKENNDCILTYWRLDSLEIIGHSDSNFVGC